MAAPALERAPREAEPQPRTRPAPDDPTGRGRFVTFEGIEGSGKSTQIAALAERVRAAGREVVLTREPGGTDHGLRIRAILLAAASPALEPTAELLLYAADRCQHLAEVVEPALARGAIVLCDRYLDATLAYQGYGRGLGCDVILELHRHPPLDRRPDRTVLLDLDPVDGLVRARRRNEILGVATREGRFEMEALAFHQRVREGYLLLAEQEPGRFRTVDGSGDVEAVASRVWHAVADIVVPGA